MKISIQGNGSETNIHEYSEKWILYTDGSFAQENYLYGIWKQKGRTFIVSLDQEDMIDRIKNMADEHLANIEVTKINFIWKENKEGIIRGSYKIYASALFEDYNNLGMIIVQGNFTGTPTE